MTLRSSCSKRFPRWRRPAPLPNWEAFEEHLEVTRAQVGRLEKVFESLGVKPKGKKCKAMEGLIEEGKEIIEEDGEPTVLDAALIGAGQKVEHYEIAGYGTVR